MLLGPVLGASVYVNSESPAVTLLVTNLSKERIIIPTNKVLAEEVEVKLSVIDRAGVTINTVSQGALETN